MKKCLLAMLLVTIGTLTSAQAAEYLLSDNNQGVFFTEDTKLEGYHATYIYNTSLGGDDFFAKGEDAADDGNFANGRECDMIDGYWGDSNGDIWGSWDGIKRADVVFDLGGAFKITKAGLWSCQNNWFQGVESFQVYVSATNSPIGSADWQLLGTITSGVINDGTPNYLTHEGINGRYVWFSITGRAYQLQMGELAVWGDIIPFIPEAKYLLSDNNPDLYFAQDTKVPGYHATYVYDTSLGGDDFFAKGQDTPDDGNFTNGRECDMIDGYFGDSNSDIWGDWDGIKRADVVFDLGHAFKVTKAGLWSGQNQTFQGVSSFEVYVSATNSPIGSADWQLLGRITSGVLNDGQLNFVGNEGINGRYVWFSIMGLGYQLQMGELAVWGDIIPFVPEAKYLLSDNNQAVSFLTDTKLDEYHATYIYDTSLGGDDYFAKGQDTLDDGNFDNGRECDMIDGYWGDGNGDIWGDWDGIKRADVVFDLGHAYKVTKAGLWSCKNVTYQGVASFEVYVSATNAPIGSSSWQFLGSIPSGVLNDGQPNYVGDEGINGQYVWFSITGQGNQLQMGELAIWGDVIPTVTQAPVFEPASKYISGPTAITITSPTEGASIYYTTNGIAPTTSSTRYTAPVTVNVGDTLSAIAVGTDTSNVTRVTYRGFNRPATIPQGSVTVDGDLADWNGATWAPLDQAYDSTAADIAEAYYAAKWQADKVYVAVKVRDTALYLMDTYTFWNARDAVEIYLHIDNPNDVTYENATTAQQYIVGIMNTNRNSVWTAIGGGGVATALDGTNFSGLGQAAGKVVGQWLQYEVALTPYHYLGYLETGDMSTTLTSTLKAGDVIGLDVNAIANNGTAFTGVKSENLMYDKYKNWDNFGAHKLVAQLPGDANGDGMVDVGDLGILAANYGGTGKSWSQGDFNGDGLVDVGDLGILAANYGKGANASMDFNADYAKVFGSTAANDKAADEEISSSACSSLGLPLLAGLALMGLMLVKIEE